MELPDGLWREVVDSLASEVALLDASGTIRYTNRQWQAFALENGLVGEQAASVGENYLAVTETEDDEYAREAFGGIRAVLDGGRSGFSMEYPCRSPDGERWFRLSAQSVTLDGDRYAAVEHLDLTDRKLAELTVAEKNERLEALYRAAQDLLQVETHEAAAEVALTAIEEVLELPLAGLWLYDDDRDVLEPVAATAEARAVVGDHPTYSGGDSLAWRTFSEKETQVFRDLSSVPSRYNPDTPIRSEISLPLGRHGVLNIGATEPDAFDDIDVSLVEMWAVTVAHVLSRISRERDLGDRERELKRQNDRLDRFASLVSHDLRNPLNVASGRVELARQECESDHLAVAERALDRMERLIDDMLVLAREGDAIGETEAVRIADLAEECWAAVETDGATLTVDGDFTVRADRSRLAQVFENLFRNSVEHGSTSGRPEADDSVEHGSAESDGVGVTVGHTGDGFYVEDDGPGIPEAERERVFESGYSTSTDGTGFGLAIARGVVEAHGWTITATGGREGGARFEITGVEGG